MPDFLDEKREEIDDRLAELRPLIEEYNRLQAASAALAEVAGSSGARSAPGTAGPAPSAVEVAPPRAVNEAPGGTDVERDMSAPVPAPVRRVHPDMPSPPAPPSQPLGLAPPEPLPASGPRRAGRPKGSGQRAAEALRIVREQPGVTIPELADRMGIKQNYLYRVLPELVQDGKVVKQGRGWHPRAA